MVNFMFYCVIFLNVILVAKSWPSGNRSLNEHEIIPNSKLDNQDFLFPDEYTTQLRFLSNSKEDMDFSAAGKGLNCIEDICDDAKDYPYDKIKEVIGQIKFDNLFNSLEGSIVELPSRFKPPGEDGSETLCATITHTVYPKQMKNENNVERFIVNVEDHKQGLVFETCVENAKCKYESMVCNYIKKRNRCDIPKDDLKISTKAVLNRQMSIRMAASTFNIPKSTLYDRLKKLKSKKNLIDSGNESSSSDEDASPLSK
ncbi:hypothetical protein RN001_004248 [Aquatica leii]|uniref:HTH psq-type domain-containing protein n=1 Tax=Aquatica leii TaxID=1421715 RepID=A0AAN7PB42_9COLE|nr:hypothetical protein RN001_004248 [Aquatica leii]